MDQTNPRAAAERAIADRLRTVIVDDHLRAAVARHAMIALLDHPTALRELLADAAEVARRNPVNVRQDIGTAEAGSTIIGYTAR